MSASRCSGPRGDGSRASDVRQSRWCQPFTPPYCRAGAGTPPTFQVPMRGLRAPRLPCRHERPHFLERRLREGRHGRGQAAAERLVRALVVADTAVWELDAQARQHGRRTSTTMCGRSDHGLPQVSPAVESALRCGIWLYQAPPFRCSTSRRTRSTPGFARGALQSGLQSRRRSRRQPSARGTRRAGRRPHPRRPGAGGRTGRA